MFSVPNYLSNPSCIDRIDVLLLYHIWPVRLQLLCSVNINLKATDRLLQRYPHHRTKMQAAGMLASVIAIIGAAFATKVRLLFFKPVDI